MIPYCFHAGNAGKVPVSGVWYNKKTATQGPRSRNASLRSGDDGGVEFQPVVEVVQVDSVLRIAVLQAVGAEDALAGGVVVVVAFDGGVQRTDRVGIELGTFLRLNPCLELRVGRFLAGDVVTNRVGVQAEAVDDHRVVAGTDSRVAVGDFAGCLEGNFLPKTRQVQHAQWAFGARTNQGNNFITHCIGLFTFKSTSGMRDQRRLARESGQFEKPWGYKKLGGFKLKRCHSVENRKLRSDERRLAPDWEGG